MDVPLISKLYQAAEDPGEWQHVLNHITHSCNAVASIITLRAQKSGLVIISEEMANELHTPYISNLSSNAVSIYVDRLIENDIWAKAQAYVHPHIPTLMFNILSTKELKKSELWPGHGWKCKG